MLQFRKGLSLIFPIICLIPLVAGITLEEFLTLTLDQKAKLDEFSDRVGHLAPHAYMKTEVFLVRWLRDSKFDVQDAESRFLKMLKWREENRMDTILLEDWSDLDKVLNTDVEGCDKEGRPVISIIMGDWDLRAIILTHGITRMHRYVDKMWEEAAVMLLRMLEDKQNVTQGSFLFDLEQFSLVTHACANCLSFYFRNIITLQNNYPGMFHKVMFLNTPQIALPIWEALKGQMRPSFQESFSVHAKNKKEWQSHLDWIDPDQLSYVFGGLRNRGVELQEIRLSGKVFRCDGELWEGVS